MYFIYKYFLPLSSSINKVIDIYGNWLGNVDRVRTELLGLNGDIFIPELSLQV